MPDEWQITKQGTDFCHTFYELADGGAIAYFQFDGPNKNLVGSTNIYYHLALDDHQARTGSTSGCSTAGSSTTSSTTGT